MHSNLTAITSVNNNEFCVCQNLPLPLSVWRLDAIKIWFRVSVNIKIPQRVFQHLDSCLNSCWGKKKCIIFSFTISWRYSWVLKVLHEHFQKCYVCMSADSYQWESPNQNLGSRPLTFHSVWVSLGCHHPCLCACPFQLLSPQPEDWTHIREHLMWPEQETSSRELREMLELMTGRYRWALKGSPPLKKSWLPPGGWLQHRSVRLLFLYWKSSRTLTKLKTCNVA